jgi:1-deoxy-D-xylulose-5-phosphate synthase
MLFEELGFEYVGPIDGHNIDVLIETLNRFKDFPGPVLIHTITKKGKGYAPAEKSPWIYHGVGPFDIETGNQMPSSNPTYSEIFGSCLVRLAREDPRIIAITAAMTEGTGLSEFAKTFPSRIYDVGIAEAHAVTFSAGLATKGFKPVVAIYSTFLQRAYDEIVHDVCLQNLPVVFAIDRAGIVGEDGPTHNGVFDLSYLRHIPNIVIMAPRDESELCDMLKTAISLNCPVAIRYPRGAADKIPNKEDLKEIPVGKSEIIRDGTDIAIIAVGNTVSPAIEASNLLDEAGISACVINARFIKPIDASLFEEFARKTKHVITVEENSVRGGFGSAVLEYLSDADINDLKIRIIGIPDTFIEHGPQKLLREECGLDARSIAKKALTLIKENTRV